MTKATENVCCVQSPVSGLLSTRAVFLARQTPSLKSPKTVCRGQHGRQHCGSMYKYEEMAAHAMFSPNVGEPQVVVFSREALANTHNVKLFSRWLHESGDERVQLLNKRTEVTG